MYKLVGTHSEVEWDSLIELQKDLSKMICKSCEEESNTLLQMLSSGCGVHYNVEKEGEVMISQELSSDYEKECEEMYGY
jgi:hypothetical protein